MTGYSFKSSEQILKFNAQKARLLQAKKEKRLPKQIDSSDEDSTRKPGTDPERWRQNLHIGSQEELVREDIVYPLFEFWSIRNRSLGKIISRSITPI